MFDIGLSEWIIVGIIALIFIKPEDLPNVARKTGDLYRKALKIYHGFLDELNIIKPK